MLRARRERQKEVKTRDIDDLISRLERMKDKMPEFSKSPDGINGLQNGEDIDKFTEKKRQFLIKFKETKDTIQELHKSSKSGTTPSSVLINRTKDLIQKQQSIRSGLRELSVLIDQLEMIHSKDIKKKNISDKEVAEDRSALIHELKVQLEKLKLTSTNPNALKDPKQDEVRSSLFSSNQTLTFTELQSQPSNSANVNGAVNGVSNGAYSKDLELSKEHELSLQQIKEKDLAFDKMLDEIEKAVVSAGRLAEALNEEATKQSAMIDEVDQKVDKVEQHVLTVNQRMKKTLVATTGCTFERLCINMMCLVCLLAIIGAFVQIIGT